MKLSMNHVDRALVNLMARMLAPDLIPSNIVLTCETVLAVERDSAAECKGVPTQALYSPFSSICKSSCT